MLSGEPPLYQRHQLPLGVLVGRNVEGRGRQVRMAGKLLNIAEAAADFRDPTGSLRQKSTPSGMRRASDHIKPGVESKKPDGYGAGRETPTSFVFRLTASIERPRKITNPGGGNPRLVRERDFSYQPGSREPAPETAPARKSLIIC